MEPPSKRTKRNAASIFTTRLFNSDSPIATQGKDIQAFLALCLLSWSDYSEEEKASIISTLPPSYQNWDRNESENLACPIAPGFVSGDKVIRDQIARFKREVTDGYHTRTWQEKARKAMDDRSKGKFDEYLARHVEEMFDDNDDDDDAAADDRVSDAGSDRDYRSKTRKRKGKDGGRGKSRMEKSHTSAQSELAMLAGDDNSEMHDVTCWDRRPDVSRNLIETKESL